MPAEAANSNPNASSVTTSAANNAISTHIVSEKNKDEAMEVDEQLGTDDVDILQSNLEYAFGVSIDDNSGIAQQFTSSPESLLQLQGLVRAALSSMTGKDVIDHSLLLDELILLAVNMIKSGDGSVANADDALSTLLPQFGLALSPVASSALDYLVGLRNRCDFLLAKSKDVAKCVMILNLLERRIMVQLVLFFRGLLSERCSYENVSAVFLERLLSEEIDTFFVHQLILCCRDSSLVDSAALVEVFNPILTLMRALILNATAEQKYNEIVEKIFMTLKQLLEVKLGDNTRPIAELIVLRPDFHPKISLTKNRGREFMSTSFLGPFLSLSIVGCQSFDLCFENASDAFSNAKLSETEKEQLMTTHRVWLGNLRINLHVVVHALVVNGSTRLQTLDYIGHLLATNRKLSQLQADFSQLANCTSVLNLFCVLLSLSEKIVTEKVQGDYLLHPKCRIDSTDEARINMDMTTLESHRQTLDLTYTPNFNTECFFLTVEFMRISLIAMMNAHSRLRRFYIGDVRRRVQEMEERLKSLGASANAAQKSRIQSALNKANEMVKQFTVSADCYQCLLNDPNLIEKCVLFTNKLLRMLLQSIMPTFGQQNFEPSFDRFYSFPESYLEVAVEFLNFLLSNSKMARIFLKNLSDFPKQLLHLLLNLENIKNPFIASKVADLLFMLCPMVNQEASGFYRQIVTDPLAVEGLFPALVKFYSAVETTGSHTEFFDKFNIRRNIQVIFKCMWSDLSHRDRMVQYAGESSPSFVRFINMVLNDTTFLLDESLDKLKMIHDIEAILSRETEWNKLSQDEQQRKTEQLRDSKSQVKMWIQLGSDTMELFVTLTNDAPEIFRNEALGERVAAMLNHNLVQLCGPKCAQLKVHDAISRFEWDPRTLTQQIVMVYINLGSTMFAEQIAQDERSYTPETFATILERFKTRNILTVNHLELFTHLAEQAEAAYKEKMLFEEEFEDEIPEEFKDALVYTLMSDPLLLPSGQICDRKNILRHLLSDPTNPFTRQPLTTDELKPADDLKTRIKGWVQEKRNSRNVEKGN
ncbi:Ubiquitin elongating factor core [Globodera pallida]|nr:Ubiquitin elongating factor core [Globodera pallida]